MEYLLIILSLFAVVIAGTAAFASYQYSKDASENEEAAKRAAAEAEMWEWRCR